MSVKALEYYTVICDFPDCGASADEDTDYSAWSDQGTALDSAVNADWWSDDEGERHYCDAHPTIWESDFGPGYVIPTVPHLRVVDNGHDDNIVVLIRGEIAA